MNYHPNYSLKTSHTFGVEARALHYFQITHQEQIPELLKSPLFLQWPRLILGGGSNILFTKDFNGVVVQISTKGITTVQTTPSHVMVKAMAGENWDDFVSYCVGQNWGGLENLTMIPGQTGTSPIQNIGAYGVELKDHFHSLEAIEIKTGKKHIFTAADCSFGYRDSFFKQEGKEQFIILSVSFQLTRHEHQLRTGYGALQDILAQKEASSPGIGDVMKAIREIRRQKLPDPAQIGNAGSFFKNPLISKSQLNQLAKQFSDIPAYKVSSEQFKISAAWLIEQAGWKGYRKQDAGVHPQHALILVNYGNATGKEVHQLAREIQQSVLQMFGIQLHPEVNII